MVVALTGGPEGDTLIRRAARIAARSSGGDLLAVHVSRSDGLTGADPGALAGQRRLVESLGGTYHQVVGDSIPDALLTFARAENATQLVLGASRRSWLQAMLTGPGIGARTIRGSGDIDVHIVTHQQMGRGRGLLPHAGGSLTRRRRLAGYLLAAVFAPVATVVLTATRGDVNLTSDVLTFLVGVILVALVGGFIPALLAAVAGSLLLNWFFTPPIHQFTIADANNAWAIGAFIIVAVLVSSVVDIAARRTKQAARAGAESELLVTTAGSVLRGQQALPALLERVRESFGMRSVSLLECQGADGGTRAGRHPGQDQPDPGPGAALDGGGHHRGRTGDLTRGRGRGGAGHRHADDGPARAAAARHRPPCAGGVRGLRGRGPGAAAAGGRGRGGQADRRGGPDADGAAHRGQPRPAQPAGLGQGRGDQPALARGALDQVRPGRAAGHRGRIAGPADPAGR